MYVTPPAGTLRGPSQSSGARPSLAEEDIGVPNLAPRGPARSPPKGPYWNWVAVEEPKLSHDKWDIYIYMYTMNDGFW